MTLPNYSIGAVCAFEGISPALRHDELTAVTCKAVDVGLVALMDGLSFSSTSAASLSKFNVAQSQFGFRSMPPRASSRGPKSILRRFAGIEIIQQIDFVELEIRCSRCSSRTADVRRRMRLTQTALVDRHPIVFWRTILSPLISKLPLQLDFPGAGK